MGDKKEDIRAEKYGWDYVSTAVVRDFAKELAEVVYDGNIGKVTANSCHFPFKSVKS